MLRFGLVGVMVGASAVAGWAQPETSSSSEVSRMVTVTENGKTRTFKQVIRDGQVVEQSGDPSLVSGFKFDFPGGPMRLRDLGLPGGAFVVDSSTDASSDGARDGKSKTWRMVIRDGEKVLDEETGDVTLDAFPGGLDAVIKNALREALRDAKMDSAGIDSDAIRKSVTEALKSRGGLLPGTIRRIIRTDDGELELDSGPLDSDLRVLKRLRTPLRLRVGSPDTEDVVEMESFDSPADELESLRAKLKALEAELKALRGRTTK